MLIKPPLRKLISFKSTEQSWLSYCLALLGALECAPFIQGKSIFNFLWTYVIQPHRRMLEMIIYEEHGASIWHRSDLRLTKISSRTAQKTLRLLMALMGKKEGRKRIKIMKIRQSAKRRLK